MKADIRQFIIYTEPLDREDFENISLDNGYILSYERHLKVSVLDNGLILLGEAIPIKEAVFDNLSKLTSDSIDDLADIVRFLSGRWTIIWKNIVISDACALMGLYFSEDCVSTSLNLIYTSTSHRNLDQYFRKPVYGDSVDWVVTPLTRIEGVRHMLCTQYLIMDSETGIRSEHYEFVFPLPCSDESFVHQELLDSFDRYFRTASKLYGKLVLPLTAGVDSRTLLALMVHAGVDFSTITLHRDSMEVSEREVPARISQICKIEHRYVMPTGDDARLRAIWHEHTFDSCASEDENFLARGQFDAIPKGALLVRGNVWEIVTCPWWKRFRNAFTGRSLAQNIADAMPQMKGDALDFWAFDVSLYGRKLDWRDSVFYEQRESAWLGGIEQSLDLLPFSHLAPINSAYLLSLMLSLDLTLRFDKLFQKHLIDKILPEISGIPYNGRTLAEKIKHYREQGLLLIGRKISRICHGS